MRTTRRQLLGVAGALATGTLGRAYAQPSSRRVRRNIASLNAQSSDVRALADAIRMLQARPREQLLSWQGLGFAHASVMNSIHYNWLFLPWHRGLIWHFERIVASLTGYTQFALPYWDVAEVADAGNGGLQRLPEILFRDPFNCIGVPDGRGQLRLANRDATKNWNDVYRGNLGRNSGLANVANSPFDGPAGFGGGSNYMGTVERGTHNLLHREIGGVMNEPWSPLDPIFWMHHANIDRVWATWERRRFANGYPYPPALVNARANAPFTTSGGQRVAFETPAWLRGIEAYDYTYDHYFPERIFLFSVAPEAEPPLPIQPTTLPGPFVVGLGQSGVVPLPFGPNQTSEGVAYLEIAGESDPRLGLTFHIGLDNEPDSERLSVQRQVGAYFAAPMDSGDAQIKALFGAGDEAMMHHHPVTVPVRIYGMSSGNGGRTVLLMKAVPTGGGFAGSPQVTVNSVRIEPA